MLVGVRNIWGRLLTLLYCCNFRARAAAAAASARYSCTFVVGAKMTAVPPLPRPSCIFLCSVPLSRPPVADEELYRKAYCLLQFIRTGASDNSRRPYDSSLG